MIQKRLTLLFALLALGVAACNDGTISTSMPAAQAQAVPAGSIAITTSGTSVAASDVPGVQSFVTIAGSGSVTAAETATLPSSLPTLLSVARSTKSTVLKPQATTDTPLLFIGLTATTATTITSLPATVVSFQNAPTGSVFLAYFTGGTWATLSGPGTLSTTSSGKTITFAAATISPAVTLQTGGVLWLAVYTGGPIPTPTPFGATPTPTPTPTPAPTPTPVATPNAVKNGDFEDGTTPSSTFTVNGTAVLVPNNWTVCTNNSELQANPSPNIFVQQNTTATVIDPTGASVSVVHGGAGSLFLGNTSITPAGRSKGGFGLCQDVVVPANGHLTFFVDEGTGGTTPTNNVYIAPPSPATSPFPTLGSEVEAAILTPSTSGTPHTLITQLFTELNGTQSAAVNNPASNTQIGAITGYVQKGPFDLSSLAGQTVTIYFGIWSSSAATTSFTFMYVDDVNLH